METASPGISRRWPVSFPASRRRPRASCPTTGRLGRSDKARLPPHRRSIVASDLHLLLAKAGIQPPYVLAGPHTPSAGMNVRHVARIGCFPDTVAGLVLIDSSAAGSCISRTASSGRGSARPLTRGQGLRADQGLARRSEYSRKAASAVGSEAEAPAGWCASTHGRAVGRSPADRAHGKVRNGTIRMARMTSTPSIDTVSQRLQAELARLSTRGKLIVASKAGHNIQAPGRAAARRSDAIVDVRAAGRKTTPGKRGGPS